MVRVVTGCLKLPKRSHRHPFRYVHDWPRESPEFKDGDVDDPATGYSPFPGNVNNLLVKIPSYAQVLAGPDQGVVDEFVNPKYKVIRGGHLRLLL